MAESPSSAPPTTIAVEPPRANTSAPAMAAISAKAAVTRGATYLTYPTRHLTTPLTSCLARWWNLKEDV